MMLAARLRASLLPLALGLLTACASAPLPAPRPATPPPASASEPGPGAPETDVVIPIAPDDAVRGARDAFATVVVFSDFECPGCRAFSQHLDRLLKGYETKDVRLVFKNYPLRRHPHAQLAAEVGQGVRDTRGSEAFFRYHDLVFGRDGELDRDALLGFAKQAGADPQAIERGLDARTWAPKIERDLALGKRLELEGTPTIYVNGIDVQDERELLDALDQELAKGKALVDKGVARDRVYAELTEANYKEAAKKASAEAEASKVDETVWRVPVGSSPVRGKADALVTVVVFSDFECPFCKKVEPTLARLREEYGDKLRLVWKDEALPFHPRARPASLLARAARAQKGDAGFWDVHDRLFASSPALADGDLEGIARAAGLDAKKAMAFVAANAPNKELDADDDLVLDVEAAGTPHFFVNGRRLVGAQPYERFKALVDEELAKAEALVKAGAAPDALYASLIKDGKTAPEPERKTVAVPASAPYRGAAGAKVVVQEFSDFQCPFCKKVEPTLDQLLEAYPGKVKIVWRDLPLSFHPDAQLAAEAAREAWAQKGSPGFSKMREKLFENQGVEGGLRREALERYGRELGLDRARLAKALDERVHREAIEADKKAAEEAGIRGTPGFLVGPYFLSGAKPYRAFRRLVERSLTEAAPSAGGKK